MTDAALGFRPLEAEDLELLVRWLADPGVKAWWYSDRDVTLEYLAAKMAPRFSGDDPVACFVVEAGGLPIGYVQTYAIDSDPEYAQITGYGRGWAGLDFYIGEPEYRGKGIGTVMLRRFVDEVIFADPAVVGCVSGPDPANTRSIRALEQAGFIRAALVEVPGDEGGPEQLMVRHRV